MGITAQRRFRMQPMRTRRASDQPAGYFDVFRTTGLVTDRWRQNMSQQDQDAVRAVVAASSLARCWADLA